MDQTKINCSLILILVTIICCGQETKKKTKSIGKLTESFYVLKSDVNVKHGDYVLRSYGNVIEKGNYEMNKKYGIWEFYDFFGGLVSKYDFSNDTLVYKYINDQFNVIQTFATSYLAEINGEFVESKLEAEPTMKGGLTRYYNYIFGSLIYPMAAKSKGVQGVVYISALITKDGQLIEEEIVQGLGYGCDEAALKAIQTVPDEWIPAKFQGEPVTVRAILTVSFKLG
jgi:protein TonB